MSFFDKIRISIEERVDFIPDFDNLTPNTYDFCDIFKSGELHVIISEIKFASPSRGAIYPGKLQHLDIASEYLSAGCDAISVLTEPEYFKGNIKFIQDIKIKYPKAHILLKDFVLRKKQIAQGLLFGANAVLLIAAFLNQHQLKELYEYAIDLGVTPLIEVHDMSELGRVLSLNPRMIGINNRNLHTLEIDLDTSRNLIKHIPDNCYTICESGIEHPIQIQTMTDIGFDGFLIGSSLMKHSHPGLQLQNILAELKRHEN